MTRNPVDLTGRRFGRLVAVKSTEERIGGYVAWLCKCDCGNTLKVPTGNLTSGNTNSCGCLNKEMVSELKTKKIASGTRFGLLTVIERKGSVGNRGSSRANYLCKCDCGNFTEVTGTDLKQGQKRSCGCLRKDIERLNSPVAMEKKMDTRKKTDLLEQTSLSSISPDRRKAKAKTSEFIGVSKCARNGLWISQMILKGQRVHHSYHKTEQDAINARKEAEEKYFKPILEKYEKETKP